MGLDDIFYILGMNMDIGRIVRHNPDNRPLGTESKATSGYHINTTAQSVLLNQADESINDF